MTATDVIVREVSGKRDLDAFLKVPFKVFEDDPNWVPQLFLERKEHLSPEKNPYFEHAKAQLFIAWRSGVPVGRISAQIDQLHLQRYGDATGQFGFIDAIDDIEVFRALLARAGNWLAERGMTRMQGPFSFSINEETGLLVDGFDTPPSIMMPHARPWYGARLKELGLKKIKDVIAYDYDISIEPPRSMLRMVGKAKKAGKLEIRPISKKHMARDLEIIIDIFNDAWSDNWGFVPMTDAEIKALGANLKMLVKEDYIAIATYDGEPAAMGVTLPNINDWIYDLDGRLLPFGWAKLLWRMYAGAPKRLRMPLMGVRKKYHGSPVGSALAIAIVNEVRQVHLKRGAERAELSWILEDNIAMRHLLDALGATPYKTYRIYEQEL
ncbi:MAG TPA: N-acetyltransferase [Rhizobiales bacterium]|nr:N-acetyltransferase [Hyphomicrobiales bacterium]